MNTRVCVVFFNDAKTPRASIEQQWNTITHNTFRHCVARFLETAVYAPELTQASLRVWIKQFEIQGLYYGNWEIHDQRFHYSSSAGAKVLYAPEHQRYRDIDLANGLKFSYNNADVCVHEHIRNRSYH